MMLPGFTVRLATRDDIPALDNLIAASVRGLQTIEYTQVQRELALEGAFGVDTQLLDDGTYFIAHPMDEPKVFAACGGWSYRATLSGGDRGAGRSVTTLDIATDAAKIRAIFVHPDYARRGLGSLILAEGEQAAYSAGFRRAEMASTLTGVPLYTLRGYRETGRYAIPLAEGESLPIIRMEKQLTGSESVV